MKGNFISVRKFIGILDIMKAAHYESEIERDIALLSFITGKPEDHFEKMTLRELREARESIAVPDIATMESKPKQFIKANGNVYAPMYMLNDLTAAQYVDATSFMQEKDQIIENLPKLLASICRPTKRGIFGRKVMKYLSVDHAKVAEDMEKANIFEVYPIALFFSKVLNGFLETTGGYLATELIKAKAMTKTKLTADEKKALSIITVAFGDGTISPDGSQTLSD